MTNGAYAFHKGKDMLFVMQKQQFKIIAIIEMGTSCAVH